MAKSKEKRAKNERETRPAAVEGAGESQSAAKPEEAETMAVKIKVIGDKQESKAAPVVGYFPSRYDPLRGEALGSSADYRAKVYRNASRNPRNPRVQVVVGVSGCTVNMVGTSYSGEAAMPQLCNYALGVLDKDSGVLKMVPIAANKIFRLDPNFDPEFNAKMEQPEDVPEAKASVNPANLTEYLSKKDIRRIEKRNMLRLSGDQGNTGETLEGIEVNTDALSTIISAMDAGDRPPFDMEAVSAHRSYPLEKIILQGEWNYLLDVFYLERDGSVATPEVYPTFVCNRIDKLKTIKEEPERKQMAGILSYITHLIKFKDKNSMDGVSSAKHHTLPSIFSQRFSSLFGGTKKEERRASGVKQELLVSYILVLSLFVDNFLSDPLDITRDLRMDPMSVRRRFEYLGCKFVRENKVLLVTLPVPLKFQTAKRKRR